MSCFACRSAPRTVGLLCAACADGLAAPDLCPEQIAARLELPVPSRADEAEGPARVAWLLDGFGVPHTVLVDERPGAAARIGRARRSDVCVAERTVSQEHALLEHRARSNAWFVLDAESDNGTWVNGDRVERRFPLEPLDRVFVGRRVGFVFVPLAHRAAAEAAAERAHTVDEAREALRWLKAQAPSTPTRADFGVDGGEALVVRVVTEGGAIASWGHEGREKAQLSELELELLVVLHARWQEERALDGDVRGFVPAQQLLEKLSFVSEAPTHANLRGLVRKVRKKLAAGDPPLDVVESRQGLGYRLARPVTIA